MSADADPVDRALESLRRPRWQGEEHRDRLERRLAEVSAESGHRAEPPRRWRGALAAAVLLLVGSVAGATAMYLADAWWSGWSIEETDLGAGSTQVTITDASGAVIFDQVLEDGSQLGNVVSENGEIQWIVVVPVDPGK